MDYRQANLTLFTEGFRPKIVAPPPSYQPTLRSANFILVKLALGTVDRSMKELKNLEGISGVHPVYGEYDLVLIVREKSKVDREALLGKIRDVKGVVEIQTLLAAS